METQEESGDPSQAHISSTHKRKSISENATPSKRAKQSESNEGNSNANMSAERSGSHDNSADGNATDGNRLLDISRKIEKSNKDISDSLAQIFEELNPNVKNPKVEELEKKLAEMSELLGKKDEEIAAKKTEVDETKEFFVDMDEEIRHLKRYIDGEQTRAMDLLNKEKEESADKEFAKRAAFEQPETIRIQEYAAYDAATTIQEMENEKKEYEQRLQAYAAEVKDWKTKYEREIDGPKQLAKHWMTKYEKEIEKSKQLAKEGEKLLHEKKGELAAVNATKDAEIREQWEVITKQQDEAAEAAGCSEKEWHKRMNMTILRLERTVSKANKSIQREVAQNMALQEQVHAQADEIDELKKQLEEIQQILGPILAAAKTEVEKEKGNVTK
ncbi:hypothetical protein K402DRAFT_451384 [Aulographum hederae CBS 113979]|uniref:Uncharacterized protein n=1 Tax=Aulographum hederae CBS 113979 TaxID=1176131 RepID=A0A6G1HBM7_9PEZI|nr:hypothetical protein K402DRAFT_451384 [Aulographum hederae CBS 113979]